jgi:hypothetical protein
MDIGGFDFSVLSKKEIASILFGFIGLIVCVAYLLYTWVKKMN